MTTRDGLHTINNADEISQIRTRALAAAANDILAFQAAVRTSTQFFEQMPLENPDPVQHSQYETLILAQDNAAAEVRAAMRPVFERHGLRMDWDGSPEPTKTVRNELQHRGLQTAGDIMNGIMTNVAKQAHKRAPAAVEGVVVPGIPVPPGKGNIR